MPKRIVSAVTAALLVTLITAGPVAADRARWTRGDAQKVLNTYPVSGDQLGDQLQIGLDIRPFPEFYSQIPYCVEDWHVVALAYWEGEFVALGGQIVYTRDDVWDSLTSIEEQFYLDGELIDTVTMPIRPANTTFAREDMEAFLEGEFGSDFELGNIWSVQWGQVLAPDELSVGDHNLEVVLTYKSGTAEEEIVFQGGTPFTVYAADSEACA